MFLTVHDYTNNIIATINKSRDDIIKSRDIKIRDHIKIGDDVIKIRDNDVIKIRDDITNIREDNKEAA